MASRIPSLIAAGPAAIAAVPPPQFESTLSHFAHEEIASDSLISGRIGNPVERLDAEDLR